MIFIQPRWIFTLAVCIMHILYEETLAELPPQTDDSNNNVYDSLLQREYAGPVVFPNHQVERKAQRSPSLRLRFGRRSDPDFISMAEKRWFGDVNQKPIRSPSLRLRFGRRSDPTMPLHSDFDILMNPELQDASSGSFDETDDSFDRIIRKPQRLRWGRSINSVSASDAENNYDEENDRDLFNALLASEKLRQLLFTIRQYEMENADANANQFLREARKQAPLRLRWGRSTGGKNSMMAQDQKLNEEKIQGENPTKA